VRSELMHLLPVLAGCVFGVGKVQPRHPD
jgi:hypothetical protein